MARSCSSSSSTSSPKYEFSDSDSDHKQRGKNSRPRRLPTSNSKNAVAARMNRMKQKQYVNDLEQKMSTMKREIKDLKRELKDREKKWASSRRQIAYLRGMITNSHQIGSLLRNIRWRNIAPQEERDGNNHHNQHLHMEPLPIAPHNDDDWVLNNGIDPPTTELFRETVPSKHVSVCMMLP